jgi:hypothetical protein
LKFNRDSNYFTSITDERSAGKFSRRAAGVVPAVSHRRVQQLRVSADGNFVGSLRATVADRHRMDYRRKIAALEISVKGKQLTKAVRL